MEKITIAQYSIKKKNIKKFIKHATKLVEKGSNEENCLAYKLLYDVDNPTEFIIYGKYANEEALEFHSSSKYLKKFFMSTFLLFSDEPQLEVL